MSDVRDDPGVGHADAGRPLDATLTPAEIRIWVAEWVTANVPPPWRLAVEAADLAELHRVRTPAGYRDWYPVLGRSGLVAPDWPVEFGGLALPSHLTRVVLEELRRWRLTRLNLVGLNLAGPTILELGTSDQKSRLLPPIVTNAEPWCQLFSEPGAGSDLAGMSTRAVASGTGWTISGQKVWTSFARDARWGLCMARTDPDVPKHAGLTAFVCDMTSDAVLVRPLRKITGDSEFSEVFIDDLHVDDADRLGDLGDGWRIAQTVLKHERQMLAGSGSGGRERASGSSVDRVAGWAARTQVDGRPLMRDEVFRDRLTDVWIESMTGRWTNERAAARRRAGLPSIHPSAQKLMQSEHNQRLQALALEASGTGYAAFTDEEPDVASVIYGFLRARGDTIAGGTSEIQRNIVAERALGLPRDPFDDRNMPWRDIPRGPAVN